MGYLLAAAITALALPGQLAPDAAPRPTPCQFAIAHPIGEDVIVTGPEDLVSRLRVLRPEHAPVVVTALDFSGAELLASTGAYDWKGRYSLEVMNVSDRPVSHVRPAVGVVIESPNGGATWEELRMDGPIAPGARARVAVPSSRGWGTAPDGEVVVRVGIATALVAGCEYRGPMARRQVSGSTDRSR